MIRVMARSLKQTALVVLRSYFHLWEKSLTHLPVNFILHLVHLRKQAFVLVPWSAFRGPLQKGKFLNDDGLWL